MTTVRNKSNADKSNNIRDNVQIKQRQNLKECCRRLKPFSVYWPRCPEDIVFLGSRFALCPLAE